MSKTASPDTPQSYYAAWGRAHQAYWDEDQARSEWLWERIRMEQARQPVPHKERARLWAAKSRQRNSVACPTCGGRMDAASKTCNDCRMKMVPCSMCGEVRARAFAKNQKCQWCSNKVACPKCNLIQHRSRRDCRVCGARMGVGL